ncbi:MAG: hypothetical protein WCG04_05015 [Alphaproteobacteria bacterium]
MNIKTIITIISGLSLFFDSSAQAFFDQLTGDIIPQYATIRPPRIVVEVEETAANVLKKYRSMKKADSSVTVIWYQEVALNGSLLTWEYSTNLDVTEKNIKEIVKSVRDHMDVIYS